MLEISSPPNADLFPSSHMRERIKPSTHPLICYNAEIERVVRWQCVQVHHPETRLRLSEGAVT